MICEISKLWLTVADAWHITHVCFFIGNTGTIQDFGAIVVSVVSMRFSLMGCEMAADESNGSAEALKFASHKQAVSQEYFHAAWMACGQ